MQDMIQAGALFIHSLQRAIEESLKSQPEVVQMVATSRRIVWSDLKNNTKKKAARLHRAASGTGGGPAVYTKLTDLEQRILNLIGHQVAIGLALERLGLHRLKYY
ncbi:hypothetical protein ACJJTC_006480 [Scirpophaga incertulas]